MKDFIFDDFNEQDIIDRYIKPMVEKCLNEIPDDSWPPLFRALAYTYGRAGAEPRDV